MFNPDYAGAGKRFSLAKMIKKKFETIVVMDGEDCA